MLPFLLSLFSVRFSLYDRTDRSSYSQVYIFLNLRSIESLSFQYPINSALKSLISPDAAMCPFLEQLYGEGNGRIGLLKLPLQHHSGGNTVNQCIISPSAVSLPKYCLPSLEEIWQMLGTQCHEYLLLTQVFCDLFHCLPAMVLVRSLSPLRLRKPDSFTVVSTWLRPLTSTRCWTFCHLIYFCSLLIISDPIRHHFLDELQF